MRTIQNKLTAVTVSTLLIGLSGCGSDTNTEDPAGNTTAERAVTIPFVAKSGTQDISCDTLLTNLGTTAATANVKNFAFYVHDVVLVGDDNNEYPLTLTTDNNPWQYENVALLDFQDKDSDCGGTPKETNDEVSGTINVPDNVEVSGIKFKMGVPFNLNHGENAVQPSPLNLPHLYWNWQGGYKFARFDVQPTAGINGDTSKVHNFHLGATGCVSSGKTSAPTVECSNPNIPQVDINLALGSQAVKLDYAMLVAGSDITTDTSFKDGCMSFPADVECPVMFDQLGLDYDDGVVSTASGVQTVFSAVDL